MWEGWAGGQCPELPRVRVKEGSRASLGWKSQKWQTSLWTWLLGTPCLPGLLPRGRRRWLEQGPFSRPCPLGGKGSTGPGMGVGEGEKAPESSTFTGGPAASRQDRGRVWRVPLAPRPRYLCLPPAPPPPSSGSAQGRLRASGRLRPRAGGCRCRACPASRAGVLSSAVPLASRGARTWRTPSSCLLSRLSPTLLGGPTCRVHPPGAESPSRPQGPGLPLCRLLGGRRERGTA